MRRLPSLRYGDPDAAEQIIEAKNQADRPPVLNQVAAVRISVRGGGAVRSRDVMAIANCLNRRFE